jgi:protein-disulfide isomerase
VRLFNVIILVAVFSGAAFLLGYGLGGGFGCKAEAGLAGAAQAPAKAPAVALAPTPAAKPIATPAAKPVAKPVAKPAPAGEPVALGAGIDFRGSPAFGDPGSAKVIVYTFSDFQCPVCRRAATNFKPLIPAILKDDALFVFKQNALEMHRNAKSAAVATVAAHRQGKFWAFHDALFTPRQDLSEASYLEIAQRLGLDPARFKADMASTAVSAQVDAEGAVATSLDARGTPSFFINGRKQVGWGSASGLQRMISREKAEVDKLMAAGKSREDAIRERIKANSDKPGVYQQALGI